MSLTLLAPVPDHTGGTLDDLPGLPLAVNLAEAGPLAQLHVAVDLSEDSQERGAAGGRLLP